MRIELRAGAMTNVWGAYFGLKPCRKRICLRVISNVWNESNSFMAFSGLAKQSQYDDSIDHAIRQEHGFTRSEMHKHKLVGSVKLYERHVFLCFRDPQSWPPQLESAQSETLPRLLAMAIKDRQKEMSKNTRLTICEGRDGTESSNGDVLIFPDMIQYKGLTHFDIETFVEDVLVKDAKWFPRIAKTLAGTHIFVCSHGSHDRRCGVCGSLLVKKFKEEIEAHGLQGHVFVRPCSHVGGHKYAGNIIIYAQNSDGEVSGHWYGYVTHDDVALVLDQHIGKGKIISRLWRGQMGLNEEEQKKAQQQRLKLNGETNYDKETLFGNGNNATINGMPNEGGECDDNDWHEGHVLEENVHYDMLDTTKVGRETQNVKESCDLAFLKKDLGGLSLWFGTWKWKDKLTTLTIVGVATSIILSYHLYNHSG